METKELKIEIPKGYEIDKDHSTFECIKFKPIKKDITYKDVCNELFKDNTGCFIDQYGEINFYNIKTNRFNANNAPSGRQLKRLLALNQLLNIAEYYNNLHGNGINTVIKYDKLNQIYIATEALTMYIYSIRAIFNRMEDAQAVIDNPNFREILDTLYKN